MTTHRAAPRCGLCAMGTIAVLLALSACTGAAGDDGVASAEGEAGPTAASVDGTVESGSLDDGAQALAFAECMRTNGVNMPDPGPGQEGLGEAFQAVAGDYDRATLDQAVSACEDLIPQFSQEEQHPEGWELDLAECLREEGLDVSDDPFDDAHRGSVDSGQFSAAMEVCRDVLTGGTQ
jgi:hypothetical protein